MSFTSPLILLFLIPWIGLVVWLLIGRRNRVAVPFLELWGRSVGAAKVKRTIQPPPLALMCALLAMLLAILGAASPILRSRRSAPRVTLIVDRGVTMSASGRRAEVAKALPSLSTSQVILVPPWPGLSADGSNWRDAPASASPTQDPLRGAVARTLADTGESVVVLSDQDLANEDRRIIQITPKSLPQNVGVVSLSASATPKPQVMVRVRNQSAVRSCDVSVTSGGETVRKTISLPQTNGQTSAFIDMPKLGDTIEAKLSLPDDLPADNTAWLVRQRTWPRIEVGSELPDALRRIVEVYQKHHVPSESSTRIILVQGLGALPSNAPGIAVLSDTSIARPIGGGVSVDQADHPVAAGVDWRAIGSGAVAGESPGSDWKALVRSGDQVLVAVREQPSRQVWVGFISPTFATLKEYVIFWTNVFDWVGQGGDQFTSERVGSISPEWALQTPPAPEGFDISPGLYRRADGAIRALNCIDVHLAKPPQSDWRRQIASLAHSETHGSDLASISIILAMLCILGAAMLWRRDPAFA